MSTLAIILMAGSFFRGPCLPAVISPNVQGEACATYRLHCSGQFRDWVPADKARFCISNSWCRNPQQNLRWSCPIFKGDEVWTDRECFENSTAPECVG